MLNTVRAFFMHRLLRWARKLKGKLGAPSSTVEKSQKKVATAYYKAGLFMVYIKRLDKFCEVSDERG